MLRTGPDACRFGRCKPGPDRFTLLVTTTEDPGPPTCEASGCGLRGAIARANAVPETDDTIAFAVSGTIGLNAELPTMVGTAAIDGSVAIQGAPPLVVVDSAGKFRHLRSTGKLTYAV